MANNLRVFNLISDYNETELVKPSVSFVVENGKVYYDDVPSPTFQGKWKATYIGGTTSSAECGSSSEIVRNEISLDNLVSVEIGDCVTSIGDNVFSRCSSLTSCTIGNSVTSIGKFAFGHCIGLPIENNIRYADTYVIEATNKTLTTYTLKDNIRFIGTIAFQGCSSLTSITIPSGVTSIGDAAFENCRSLTSVTIPNSVTSIGLGVFHNCTSLTSITVNATTPPTLEGWGWFDSTNNCPIYVPSQSVNVYKSASGWSDYASRIFPIS